MKGKFLYVAAAVLSLAVISTVAVAKHSSEVEITYMDSKGNVVGGKTLHCEGMTTQWGAVTANSVKYFSPCN